METGFSASTGKQMLSESDAQAARALADDMVEAVGEIIARHAAEQFPEMVVSALEHSVAQAVADMDRDMAAAGFELPDHFAEEFGRHLTAALADRVVEQAAHRLAWTFLTDNVDDPC